jgi:hypothetical protein
MIEQNRNTKLPRAILQLPIFNREIPVYYIKFLGATIVYKNQKYINTHFTSKEQALFIHLSQKVSAPRRSVILKDLYANFLPRSKNPAGRFSHLLMSLRQKLLLPKHLISVTMSGGEKRLVNGGFYLTTDYTDFKTMLAEAKVLESTGEPEFATKEYRYAFRLFRGEPFRRMYDNWSENMRRVILNKLEIEAIHFVKSCLEHGNKKDARKILKKVSKIIPNSTELTEILETCK